MTILVTGGTGFIGRALVRALAAHHEVVCVVRDPARVMHAERVTVVQADFSGLPSFKDFPHRADAIVHLAQANGSFPESANELFAVNLATTQWLAAYARRAGVSHVVYTSTGNVYAHSLKPIKETDPIHPDSFFAWTKYRAERLLEWYQHDFHIGILRLFTPYGPGQENRLIPKLIQAVRDGRPVVVTNDGQPHVNPIFIDDVVWFIEQVLLRSGHDVINVGGPQAAGMDTIAALIGEMLGKPPVFERRTERLQRNLIGDTTNMRSCVAMREWVGLREGLRRTVESSEPQRIGA